MPACTQVENGPEWVTIQPESLWPAESRCRCRRRALLESIGKDDQRVGAADTVQRAAGDGVQRAGVVLAEAEDGAREPAHDRCRGGLHPRTAIVDRVAQLGVAGIAIKVDALQQRIGAAIAESARHRAAWGCGRRAT